MGKISSWRRVRQRRGEKFEGSSAVASGTGRKRTVFPTFVITHGTSGEGERLVASIMEQDTGKSRRCAMIDCYAQFNFCHTQSLDKEKPVLRAKTDVPIMRLLDY